jgi:hypothetical protein
MFLSLLLTLVATASGTVVSYLYDDDAPLVVRLCAGCCSGLAALGLFGFVCSSVLGLTPLAIALSAFMTAAPLILLDNPNRLASLRRDIEAAGNTVRRAVLRPTWSATGYFFFYFFFAVLLWLVFDRAMYVRAGEIYTGVLNNLGDLPFHIAVISSFAKGANFPPEDPTYAGVRFTYPFISDFVSAMFARGGANLRDSIFVENYALALSTVGLLHYFGLKLTRDKTAGILTPLIVIFSGGLGWWEFFNDTLRTGLGVFSLLMHMPLREYTITPTGPLRWGNAISTLLVPQRGMLMALPIALIVFTAWWKVFENRDAKDDRNAKNYGGEASKAKTTKRPFTARAVPGTQKDIARPFASFVGGLQMPANAIRMIVVGAIAGLLPLVHAHTFVVVMVVGACLALISGPKHWREWALFFWAALIIGGPQMAWAALGSSVRSSEFFGWNFGWDHGTENVVWFWIRNTGLFIPFTIAALAWRGRNPVVPRRLALFYLPFTLCFIVPNIVKLAPWTWDNIKVLFYWWVASAPIVALLFARLLREWVKLRVLTLFLLISIMLAGALDVWRIVSRQVELRTFDSDGVEFARFVEANTPPRALILHAPIHNHPLFLTGRRSVMGYPGHIWTHGLPFVEREAAIKRIYSGAPDAGPLLTRSGVDYVVVSAIENGAMIVNEEFFEQGFSKVGEVGEYRLYKVSKQ